MTRKNEGSWVWMSLGVEVKITKSDEELMKTDKGFRQVVIDKLTRSLVRTSGDTYVIDDHYKNGRLNECETSMPRIRIRGVRAEDLVKS